jgi:hypothetical protein
VHVQLLSRLDPADLLHQAERLPGRHGVVDQLGGLPQLGDLQAPVGQGGVQVGHVDPDQPGDMGGPGGLAQLQARTVALASPSR